MNKYSNRALILFLFLLLVLSISNNAICEENPEIQFDFYYNSYCGSCVRKKEEKVDPIIEDFSNQSDKIIFRIKDYPKNDTWKKEYNSYKNKYDIYYPFLIIQNQTNITIIESADLDYDLINDTLQKYLAGIKLEERDNDTVTVDTIFGKIDINSSSLSLPVLTIILGGVDSFNPCAFFILIILLNLLVHANSKKRMLLIGGIFIFFSGLLYALFMVAILEIFMIIETIFIITIIAGILAITLGLFDIKDFFFFKKGASISIPDSKKKGIYAQMRNLVKHPKSTAVIFGTIVLAATINLYELLCSLGLPIVFTRSLAGYNLSQFESFMYIFFYNVVYVIPLVVIVSIFIFTLGRYKMTDWHARILKLFAGILLFCFGIIMLVDYRILEDVTTPILLLVFTIVSTFVISQIWKITHPKNIK